MERHRAQIEQKERIAEEFRKNLSLSKEEAAQTLALTLALALALTLTLALAPTLTLTLTGGPDAGEAC